MAKANDMTADDVRQFLRYEPNTGRLLWTPEERKRRRSDVAGTLVDGYLLVRVHGRLRLAHRLAWLLHYGEWPKHVIDHINGDRSDNRIENLRDVPQMANMRNNRRSRGVARHVAAVRNGDRWDAVVFRYGKAEVVGTFDTCDEANQAAAKEQKKVDDPMRPRPQVKPLAERSVRGGGSS